METPYIAQASDSGKVERRNWTLKITLAKLCQETQSPWIDMLPCSGRALWLLILWDSLWQTPSHNKQAQRRPQANWKSRHVLTSPGLRKTLCHISQEGLERAPIPMGNWSHPHQPMDLVWVKDWKKEPLQPSWMGAHLIILATPIAVKVASITPWIHHS
jgi:hypothetical protein